jgi:hypothetical protein
MRYKNIRMDITQNQPTLLLGIDGVPASIFWEQKPTLFLNGFLFIQPQKIWSNRLPEIYTTLEGKNPLTLRSFIRSKSLIPLILEMCQTRDVEAFNRKWEGKEIEEEISQVTSIDIEEQLDHFTI